MLKQIDLLDLLVCLLGDATALVCTLGAKTTSYMKYDIQKRNKLFSQGSGFVRFEKDTPES